MKHRPCVQLGIQLSLHILFNYYFSENMIKRSLSKIHRIIYTVLVNLQKNCA